MPHNEKKGPPKHEKIEMTDFLPPEKTPLGDIIAADEVLLNILRFLDVKSLLAFRRTNKFFNFFGKEASLWEKLFYHYLSEKITFQDSQDYYRFFMTHKKFLAKLIHLIHNPLTADVDNKLFDYLSETIKLKENHQGLEKLFMRILVHHPDFDINHRDNGICLVDVAVQHNNSLILSELMERHANITYRKTHRKHIVMQASVVETPIPGMNFLELAAYHGAYECLKILLATKKFSPDAQQSGNRKTALHCAAEEGHLRCIELLVSHGATLNLEDSEENTPYQLAIANGHLECAEFLAARMKEKNLAVPEVTGLRHR